MQHRPSLNLAVFSIRTRFVSWLESVSSGTHPRTKGTRFFRLRAQASNTANRKGSSDGSRPEKHQKTRRGQHHQNNHARAYEKLAFWFCRNAERAHLGRQSALAVLREMQDGEWG